MNSVTITVKEGGCSSANRPLAGSLGTRPAASSPPRGKPRSRHREVYPLGSAPRVRPLHLRDSFWRRPPTPGSRPGAPRPGPAAAGARWLRPRLHSPEQRQLPLAPAGGSGSGAGPHAPPHPPAGGGRAEPSPAAPRRAAREARGRPLPPGTAGEGRWSYPAGRARGGERGSGSAGGSVASPCSVTLRPWARGGKEGRSSPLATLPARNGGVRALRALSPSAEE